VTATKDSPAIQRQRVLRHLERAGRTNQGEWISAPAVDGGPKITRLAARILELKDDGHRIGKSGRHGRYHVYCLLSPPGFSTLEPLDPVEWRSGWRCLRCDARHPARYQGECCGEHRFLIQVRLAIPARRKEAA
jgi:hypothetical protein